jgi:hypothetical protein
MTRHTPGSWNAVKYPDVKGHSIYALKGSGNGHQTLASVKHPNPEVQAANAKLIAASPELAEFLNHFMSVFDSLNPYMTMKKEITPDQINALIKKAIVLKGKIEGYL